MSHNHCHHHHGKDLQGKRLLWVTLLNFSITIIQIIGGLVSNSLSLLSDALHNLADSSAIFLAFIANNKSKQKANKRNTFGYKRFEILAALFNSFVLIAICIFLFQHAYHRFLNPEAIKGKTMLIVATFGLLANLISVLVLQKDKNKSLNVRAAYLHLMGDTLSSVAVIVGGFFIWKYNILWIDPLITILVGIYIIHHTWSVLKESFDILMQATPPDIDLNQIQKNIEKFEEVENIHHIHVWRLNDEQLHLEAHINLENNINMREMMKVKTIIEQSIKENFNINHITLQMEYQCCKNQNALIHTH